MISRELMRQITGYDPEKYTLRFSKRVLAMPENKIRSIRAGIPSGKARGVSSGTTIVAMKFEGGVLMAADRQTSAGYQIWGESTKISEITDYSIWGAAGMVSCIQELRDTFKDTADYFEQMVGKPIYIDGQARILTRILRENFEALSYLQYMFDYVCDPLLIGWDPEKKRGKIFVFESGGATFDKDNPGYAVAGSGGDFAQTILDDRWHTKLTIEEAALLAIRALLIAGQRDIYTSDAIVHPSTVWAITENGIQKMPAETALIFASHIAKEIHKHKGSEHSFSIHFGNRSKR